MEARRAEIASGGLGSRQPGPAKPGAPKFFTTNFLWAERPALKSIILILNI